jgi:hypothetical protein
VSTGGTVGNDCWENNGDKLVSEDELYERGAKVAWTHCKRHDCNTSHEEAHNAFPRIAWTRI